MLIQFVCFFIIFYYLYIIYIYIEREREREKIIFYQKKNNNKALDAILVLNKEEISGHYRVDNVIKKLGQIKSIKKMKLYMCLNLKYMNIQASLQNCSTKLKHGIQMSDNLSAYGLLKSANYSELHKQMVKGTVYM